MNIAEILQDLLVTARVLIKDEGSTFYSETQHRQLTAYQTYFHRYNSTIISAFLLYHIPHPNEKEEIKSEWIQCLYQYLQTIPFQSRHF